MVTPWFGKLPDPLVFRAGLTTGQVKAFVLGHLGSTRGGGGTLGNQRAPQWVLGASYFSFVGAWGEGDSGRVKEEESEGERERDFGLLLPGSSPRFWATEVRAGVGVALVFRFWSEKQRFNPASPAYPK